MALACSNVALNGPPSKTSCVSRSFQEDEHGHGIHEHGSWQRGLIGSVLLKIHIDGYAVNQMSIAFAIKAVTQFRKK